MAVALVASVAIPGAPNGGTSSSIDTTGATLLVIHVADADSAATAVFDSKVNTWTALTTRQNSVESQLYYCASPTVGSGHTFSTSASSAFPAGQVLAFSGVDATPFDAQNGNTAFDSTIATGSVTPAEDGSVIVAGVAHVRGVSPTIGSSFTITDSNALSGGTYYGAGAAYLIQTTASAVNPTWTLDSSGSLAATIAVFSPSAGGDVSLALTGQAAAASAGTLAPSSSVATTGQAATASAGIAVPSISKAASGQSATASAGTVAPSATVAASGQAATASAGTVTYNASSDISVAITGQAVTASAGALATSSAKAIAGSASTASAGTIAPAASVSASGAQLTTAAGTLSLGIAVPLASAAAAASSGTVTYSAVGDVSVALSGQAVTASAGTIDYEVEALVRASIPASRRERTGATSGRPSQLSAGRRPKQ